MHGDQADLRQILICSGLAGRWESPLSRCRLPRAAASSCNSRRPRTPAISLPSSGARAWRRAEIRAGRLWSRIVTSRQSSPTDQTQPAVGQNSHGSASRWLKSSRSYESRQTLEFERGNFLTKTGPALTPDVPGLFPKLPAGAPRNRLTLAKWFFSPGQPLTARTAVNRYWEQLFGTGIVETLENFGSVGEEPSHPELLDWLALHFQNDLHWDMKALLARTGHQRYLSSEREVELRHYRERSSQSLAGARPAATVDGRDGPGSGFVGQWTVDQRHGRASGDAAATSGGMEFGL